ncbi:MAG: oxidoreductase [Bacteroidota bacterium]|nr:oxidoreductase [Bacteroidota bacterium]
MESIISVGLASYGLSGMAFHAPLLTALPCFNLKKILERHHDNSRDRFPQAEIVRSFDDLISDPDIELVVVNTPDHTHFELAQKALLAGKHVVVEKPFTFKVEDCEELIRLAKEKHKVLSVFQNRRWDGDFLTVKNIVHQGLLGKLVYFESNFDRYRNYLKPESWKEQSVYGSGTVYNLGSHLIDQALVLFGMPESVTADIRNMREGAEVDDYFNIRLGYSAFAVTLKSSYLVRESVPRFVLHGRDGSFIKYGMDPQEDAMRSGIIPVQPEWGQEKEEYWGLLNTQLNGLHYRGKVETIAGDYKKYYQNIYQVIRNNEVLEVKPEESLAVIKIIRAAFESSEKQTTVRIS